MNTGYPKFSNLLCLSFPRDSLPKADLDSNLGKLPGIPCIDSDQTRRSRKKGPRFVHLIFYEVPLALSQAPAEVRKRCLHFPSSSVSRCFMPAYEFVFLKTPKFGETSRAPFLLRLSKKILRDVKNTNIRIRILHNTIRLTTLSVPFQSSIPHGLVWNLALVICPVLSNLPYFDSCLKNLPRVDWTHSIVRVEMEEDSADTKRKSKRTSMVKAAKKKKSSTPKRKNREQEYEVEAIISHTVVDGVVVYQVTWVGYPGEVTDLLEEDLRVTFCFIWFRVSLNVEFWDLGQECNYPY
ncbi:hypothetical protein Y032_0025g1208 [Ancylostoma ceylanicum]|uniref:Chromo domain-containing protein n=1 Tax=Ancylostoma ceylanicum TaxID=53326 RepID=A0A016UUQ6_9BILA|nr:hypothetical protein Y032_0025g1208 [Ancylostoma ceylanicum]